MKVLISGVHSLSLVMKRFLWIYRKYIRMLLDALHSCIFNRINRSVLSQSSFINIKTSRCASFPSPPPSLPWPKCHLPGLRTVTESGPPTTTGTGFEAVSRFPLDESYAFNSDLLHRLCPRRMHQDELWRNACWTLRILHQQPWWHFPRTWVFNTHSISFLLEKFTDIARPRLRGCPGPKPQGNPLPISSFKTWETFQVSGYRSTTESIEAHLGTF